MQILNLLNKGKGRHQIASDLGISVETVRTRIDQIKTELDVPLGQDIRFTVQRAYDRGVLKGPSPLLDPR
jgi:DNA-binding NarL/FixJ family response regulator